MFAPEEPIPVQVEKEIEFLHQNGWCYSYTFIFKLLPIHGPVEVLRERFEQAVDKDQILFPLILGRVRIAWLMMLDYLV